MFPRRCFPNKPPQLQQRNQNAIRRAAGLHITWHAVRFCPQDEDDGYTGEPLSKWMANTKMGKNTDPKENRAVFVVRVCRAPVLGASCAAALHCCQWVCGCRLASSSALFFWLGGPVCGGMCGLTLTRQQHTHPPHSTPTPTSQDENTCIGCKQCVWCAPATFRIEDTYGRSRVFAQVWARVGWMPWLRTVTEH